MAYPISGGSSINEFRERLDVAGRRPRPPSAGVPTTVPGAPSGGMDRRHGASMPSTGVRPSAPSGRDGADGGGPWRGLTPGEPPNQERSLPNYNRDPDAPLDWSDDGAGGGGGGGGGFSAASWSAPTIARTAIDTSALDSRAHLDDALARLESARQEALGEKAGLDEQFALRMADLRDQFQFTETADEKRLLSRMLADLEAQRDAGYQAIASGYQQAVQDVQARGQQMRASTVQEQTAVGDLYDRAVAQVQSGAQATNDQYDAAGQGVLGVGADGGSAGAADWAAMLASEGAAEQALTGRLGDISAEGADWMASTLQGQQLAQQGDLDRLAMATSTQAEMEHQRRVLDRVQQERMMFNDLYGRTRQSYDERGWGLGDQARQLSADQGQYEFQYGDAQQQRRLEAALQQAQMDQQRALANAEMQAQARASNAAAANSARASAASGGSSGPRYSPQEAISMVASSPSRQAAQMLGESLEASGSLPAGATARLVAGLRFGG